MIALRAYKTFSTSNCGAVAHRPLTQLGVPVLIAACLVMTVLDGTTEHRITSMWFYIFMHTQGEC
jgi:hypothetical protein